MEKKIIGIFVCILVIATCLPVTGIINNDEKPNADIAPEITKIWPKEHVLRIVMDKVYVYNDGDNTPPGEYFFKIFVFPKLTHLVTTVNDVTDDHPDVPYNFEFLGEFGTKFTPQFILILAIEEDKKEDLNFNDFMDWKVFKVNPPAGDYPHGINTWVSDPVVWENNYFKAIVKFWFFYNP